MNPAIKQAADEIAPELNRLLNEWLASDMQPATPEYRKLAVFLWDNKVGMLRVLQSVAHEQNRGQAMMHSSRVAEPFRAILNSFAPHVPPDEGANAMSKFITNVRELRDPTVLPKELRRIADALEYAERQDILQHAADELEGLSGRLRSIVQTVGGTVDGNPTGSHNVLQRIRELLAIEARCQL